MDQATKLRERVQTNQEISNARVIAITSGKGGVGKTTLSVNIALELARRGKKVVVFDADFGLANVEVMLGIRPQYNLLDLIHNNKSMTEIITQGPEGIGFISGGITDSVMEFVMMSPEVVLVVTPEPTSITDSYSLLKVLRRKNSFNPLYKTIHVVANRVENEAEGAEIFHKIDTVSSKFLNTKLSFLGAVLQDKNASMAVIEQKPLVQAYPGTTATKGICQLVNRLSDDTVEESKKKEGIARVFIDFFRSKKRIR